MTNIIKECNELEIDPEAIKLINNDIDLKAGIISVHRRMRTYIGNLPLKTQLHICLEAVAFANKQIMNHLKETELLNKDIKEGKYDK